MGVAVFDLQTDQILNLAAVLTQNSSWWWNYFEAHSLQTWAFSFVIVFPEKCVDLEFQIEFHSIIEFHTISEAENCFQ
jgi:hypothetical protein